MSHICCKNTSEQVIHDAFHSPFVNKNKTPKEIASSSRDRFVLIKVEGGVHTTTSPVQNVDTDTGFDRRKLMMTQPRCNSAKSVMSDYSQYTTTSTTSAIKSIVISPSSSSSTTSSSPPIYFIEHSDPCAKQSKSILKSKNVELKNKLNGSGDGDIWIEKRCLNKKTGKKRFLFVSENTGVITREPPTGATRVLYADELVSEQLMREHLYDVDEDRNPNNDGDIDLDFHASDDLLNKIESTYFLESPDSSI